MTKVYSVQVCSQNPSSTSLSTQAELHVDAVLDFGCQNSETWTRKFKATVQCVDCIYYKRQYESGGVKTKEEPTKLNAPPLKTARYFCNTELVKVEQDGDNKRHVLIDL